MVRLTSSMRTMIREGLPMLATASKNGSPNIGPRIFMQVIDDETLAWPEYSQKTKSFKNLIENDKMAVIMIDKENIEHWSYPGLACTYQFKGTAKEVSANSEIFDIVIKRLEKMGKPKPKTVIKMSVEEIYIVKPGAFP